MGVGNDWNNIAKEPIYGFGTNDEFGQVRSEADNAQARGDSRASALDQLALHANTVGIQGQTASLAQGKNWDTAAQGMGDRVNQWNTAAQGMGDRMDQWNNRSSAMGDVSAGYRGQAGQAY